MITINTYLKIQGNFVHFEDYQGPIRDPFYIDGAIELSVDGQELFGLELWDLVDQLWAYIAQGLLESAKGKKFKSHFPDQAIEMQFISLDRNYLKIMVNIKDEEQRTAIVNKAEILTAAREHISNFVIFLDEKLPQYRHSNEELLTTIDEANQSFAHLQRNH